MTRTRHARRSWIFALLPALLALSSYWAPPAAAAGPPATQPPAGYILVDADSGAVLLGRAEHDPHFTASTIKVLTALVTLEHRSLESTLQVSALAASQPASKIDMKEGSNWTVDQALHSLMIISANDAAYAMAENVGGDLTGFAAMATATGRRLGLQNTDFRDPAGLDGPEGFGGGTKSSAYDLAIVARNALKVPAIADAAKQVTYEFTDPSGAGRRLVNHNRGFLTGYPGAVGLKTGFTDQASRTLITAAQRDGRTLIAIVMGTWDDTGWAGYLLDQGFSGTTPAPTTPLAMLPPVRLATLDSRVSAFAGVPNVLGSGAPTAATTAKPTPQPATDKSAASSPPSSKPSSASKSEPSTATPAAATPSTQATPSANATTSDGGITIGSVLKAIGWLLLALLIVGVVLRRRAVKRQRARRIERLRAHREARRRGMIDILEADDAVADIRVLPARTAHHVASAGKRHPADRRVVRPARPRRPPAAPSDRNAGR
ncbi:MAG: serine hydrolase [Acidimicrobiia bacterium]